MILLRQMSRPSVRPFPRTSRTVPMPQPSLPSLSTPIPPPQPDPPSSLHIRGIFFCCGKTLTTNLPWRGKGLFQFILYNPLLKEARAGIQGRTVEADLKQRPWTNTAYWLAPGLTSSRLSSQDHLPRVGIIQTKLDPPISTKNHANTTSTCLLTNLMRFFFSLI